MQGVAVFVLVLDGNVDWNYGAPMAIGGLVGGYIGGSVASREPDRCSLDRYGNRFCRVRHYFWKLYGQSVMHLGGNSEVREELPFAPISSQIFRNGREPVAQAKSKCVFVKGVKLLMKTLTVTIAAFLLLFSVVSSRGENVDRLSAATGVPVETLQAEGASTGLGWGGIEKAHLLANATGQNFDNIVALHQSGQGWGKIAHDNGLNLGRLVSNANRSSTATSHARNTQTVHGKNSSVHGRSATNIGRGHSSKMTTRQGVSHGSSFRSARTGFRGTHGMGHGGHGR